MIKQFHDLLASDVDMRPGHPVIGIPPLEDCFPFGFSPALSGISSTAPSVLFLSCEKRSVVSTSGAEKLFWVLGHRLHLDPPPSAAASDFLLPYCSMSAVLLHVCIRFYVKNCFLLTTSFFFPTKISYLALFGFLVFPSSSSPLLAFLSHFDAHKLLIFNFLL